MWDVADVATREYLIDRPRRDTREHKTRDPEELARRKALEHLKLRRMIEYADTATCLRATILRYFGDCAIDERCTACGSCRPDAIDVHERELVRTILSGIASSGERYGRHRIVAMLRGEIADLPHTLAGLPSAGLLRHDSPDAVHRWVDASIGAGLILVSNDQYRTLSLTPRGREMMRGRLENVEIRRPAAGTIQPAMLGYRGSRYDSSGTMMRRRRPWSSSVDAPFEFDVDFRRRFDDPDE